MGDMGYWGLIMLGDNRIAGGGGGGRSKGAVIMVGNRV